MLKLYNVPLSGNCHKVRLMLSLLGVKHEVVPIDMAKGEHKTPEYLKINPLGKVPAIDDGGTVIWDSQAILVYLARKYGTKDWFPDDAAGMAEVVKWLAFATHEIWNGPAIARAIIKFNRPLDLPAAQKLANDALGIMDGWLKTHDWLACGRPTVADVACYPYASMAWEGQVDMSPYKALNAWIARVEALPGYVGMPNMPRPK